MEVSTKNLEKQTAAAEGGSTAAAAAEKEIEGLVQDVVAKGFAKAAEIEVNDALLKVLDQTTEAAQENRGEPKGGEASKHTDSQNNVEGSRYSDWAVLSNESLTYNRGEEEEAARQEELKILLETAWNFLEGWQPLPGLGLSQEIGRLGDIYRQLLQDIMKLYTQSQAEQQADRINTLLLEIIDKMGAAKFPNLLSLLEKHGEGGLDNLLRASILRQITGRTVSPQDVAAAREHREKSAAGRMQEGSRTMETGRAAASGRTAQAGRTASAGKLAEDGILYQREMGKGVNRNPRYRESVREAEQFLLRFEGKEKGKAVSPGAAFFPFRGNRYTAADIERAERFLQYISREGNLYNNPQITAGNEELLGFLMAVNMTKMQIFTEYSGVGKEMAADLRGAMEQFFGYYLRRTVESHQNMTESDGSRARLDVRVIQKIYYQVMELIHHLKTPGKGLERGLQYAWQVFAAKKENEEYRKYKRYRQNAGFFVNKMEDKDEIKEIRYGAAVLDKDWKEFLGSVGQSRNSLLQVMISNSPWGMLLTPEGKAEAGKEPMPAIVLLLSIAGVCLLLALAAVLLRAII